MAETAAILNPEKTVVHPEPLSQCAMASRLTVAEIERARARYPGVPVVTYVNSSAAVKAVSDICCTSANAVRVVESARAPRVIFAPDRNLAAYVAARTGVEVIPVPALGCCPTHQALSVRDFEERIAAYPRAEVMVHPETTPAVQALADFIGSTSAMIRRVQETDATTVIVGTEVSILHRMRKAGAGQGPRPGLAPDVLRGHAHDHPRPCRGGRAHPDARGPGRPRRRGRGPPGPRTDARGGPGRDAVRPAAARALLFPDR